MLSTDTSIVHWKSRPNGSLEKLISELSRLTVDPERVVHSFLQYLSNNDMKVSRAEFEENLLKKLDDAAFRGDIRPLLRPGIAYDVDEAARYMLEQILSRLPGKPWKRTD